MIEMVVLLVRVCSFGSAIHKNVILKRFVFDVNRFGIHMA